MVGYGKKAFHKPPRALASTVSRNFKIVKTIPQRVEEQVVSLLSEKGRLKSEKDDKVFARAHTVQVCIEKRGGTAIIIPESIRDIITNYEK